MSAESAQGQCRPLWLSVPAASGGAHFDQLDRARWRILRLVADHSLSLSSCSGGQGGGSQCLETGTAGSQVLQAHLAIASAHADTLSAPSVTATVLDLGGFQPGDCAPGIQVFDLARGSADTRLGPAMTYHQLDRALSVGRQAVERAKLDRVHCIALQGAGAGAATTNQVWLSVLGKDTGAGVPALLNGADPRLGRRRAGASTCQAILARHARVLHQPYPALRHLGGLEHAALVGAALAAAQLGLPVLGMGPSASIGVSLAVRLNASIAPWVRIATDDARVDRPNSIDARRRCRGARFAVPAPDRVEML